MSHPLVAAVRAFVETEVRPVAAALEHADEYPHALVARLRELGLFGALVPEAYGGLGLDVTTYAQVIEEICRGFMSLAGVLNSHTMAALIVLNDGTDEQRARFLPRLARGEARGGLALTEPHAGTDVQAIRTVARRRGDEYVISGSKMFITNGYHGNTLALLALTDPRAEPRHKGMSCFIVEKGHPGFKVVKSISKLGYKGVDTVELLFDECVVPAANLVGGVEGRGFKHVMGGLETGRINIAARAVGVAQAAYEDTLRDAVDRAETPPALADMAAKVSAARLLTTWAAAMKDRGERCDLEAGMAKLHASETAHEVALAALRAHGPSGVSTELNVERYYRDTPLMIIGEGTNEIQRAIIARNLVERHGERFGALVSRESEAPERREMVLAVRQFVEKQVVPVAQALDAAGAWPGDLVRGLGELGVLGALAPQDEGGLGLDPRTWAMLVEEVARGSATLAVIITAHSAAVHVLARFGTPAQRASVLGPMTRGELLGAPAWRGPLDARPRGAGWTLEGFAVAENAARADAFLAWADVEASGRTCFVLRRDAPGLSVGQPPATLGTRAVQRAAVMFERTPVTPSDALGGAAGNGGVPCDEALALLRLGTASTAVGLAQAAFEAALRYSQQRTTFGRPICQHQAVQLKLADMATRTAAARLLTYDAAERGGPWPALAKVYASEIAGEVTLDAMRVHGGYGYTTEFPVERHYRDAAQLLCTPLANDGERRDAADALVAPFGPRVERIRR